MGFIMGRPSYRHSQEFAVREVCGDVVRLGSQRLSVPVFSLAQLVQPHVGLSCQTKTQIQGQRSSLETDNISSVLELKVKNL